MGRYLGKMPEDSIDLGMAFEIVEVRITITSSISNCVTQVRGSSVFMQRIDVNRVVV